jgi:hypothetical protein
LGIEEDAVLLPIMSINPGPHAEKLFASQKQTCPISGGSPSVGPQMFHVQGENDPVLRFGDGGMVHLRTLHSGNALSSRDG